MVLEQASQRIGGAGSAPDQRGPGGAPLTFAHLLDDVVAMYGDKIAYQQKVRRDWQRASFVHIRNQSYGMAAGLVSLDVKPGDRVALIAENSIEWVCAYYSIVLAGAIAVPIYYDLRPVEVEDALQRSGARVAYMSGKSMTKFGDSLAGVRSVVEIGEAGPAGNDVPAEFRRGGHQTLTAEELIARADEGHRAEVAARRVLPDDVASIVFTSGTSGGMKGVMLTHRNFMANLQQVRSSIPLNDRDRIAMVLPMHHAFPFTISIAVAPYIGGEVTFENDLRRIRDRMAEVKPTIFLGVPQLFEVMWRNILHGIEVQGKMETFKKGMRIQEATKKRTGVNLGRIIFRELHARLGGSLRFAVSGGAALNPETQSNFAKIGLPIIQGWGLTEAAPVLAAQRWNPRKFYMTNHYEEQVGTVGQALDGVEIALIDVPEKELYVHLHGEGELVARGDNIMPGYWESEETSAAAKVGEWLRTGDVGRIDADGNVWITGRSKFVIVLDSGEKIHPDEVEERLELSPVIEDVAIVGKKVRGKVQPWAIVYPNYDEVIAKLGDAPTEVQIRELVQAEIASREHDIAQYKRPVEFVMTDTPLPRTKPLRKLARGQIVDEYSFEAGQWAATWPQHLDSMATPGGGDGDDELEAAVAAGA